MSPRMFLLFFISILLALLAIVTSVDAAHVPHHHHHHSEGHHHHHHHHHHRHRSLRHIASSSDSDETMYIPVDIFFLYDYTPNLLKFPKFWFNREDGKTCYFVIESMVSLNCDRAVKCDLERDVSPRVCNPKGPEIKWPEINTLCCPEKNVTIPRRGPPQ